MVASTMSGQKRVTSKLTAQEQEIINVSFDSFAEDVQTEKDGTTTTTRYIDTDKLREALNAVGDMTDIQLLIDDIDENGDGKIDKTEWTAIMSRKFLGEEDDSSFMHVFMMLDDNKDGYIPLVELRKMLMSEGQAPLSEQEVDELMMFADLDCDGLVNYRNFLRWLSAPHVYMQANQRRVMEKLITDLKLLANDEKKNKAALAAKLAEARETLDSRLADQAKEGKEADPLDQDLQKAIEIAQTALDPPKVPPPGPPANAKAKAGSNAPATPTGSNAAAKSNAPKAQTNQPAKGSFPTDSGSGQDDAVKTLMDMSGRNEADCKAALQKHKGDTNAAAAELLA